MQNTRIDYDPPGNPKQYVPLYEILIFISSISFLFVFVHRRRPVYFLLRLDIFLSSLLVKAQTNKPKVANDQQVGDQSLSGIPVIFFIFESLHPSFPQHQYSCGKNSS